MTAAEDEQTFERKEVEGRLTCGRFHQLDKCEDRSDGMGHLMSSGPDQEQHHPIRLTFSSSRARLYADTTSNTFIPRYVMVDVDPAFDGVCGAGAGTVDGPG